MNTSKPVNQNDTVNQMIKRFTKNLNEEFRQEEKIKIVGREKETREIIDVLTRLIKNNPLLVGPPGVGKTAIVEALAQKIENNDVPQYLFGKNIVQIDVMSLMAGTKFQGVLEERLKAIIDWVVEQKNVILFIDEVHTLIGAGRGPGSGLDISNLLKPALSKAKLQCIAATTQEEYSRYIEKDEAFDRRFSKVRIDEPTLSETRKILEGIRGYFENHYKLKIKDDALEAVVELSARYLSDKYFPDKAINLLDETCARVKSEMWYEPELIKVCREKLAELEIERAALNSENNGEDTLNQITLQEEVYQIESELRAGIAKDEREKDIIRQLNLAQEKLVQLQAKLKELQGVKEYVQASKVKYEEIPNLEKELRNLEEQAQKNIFRNYFVKKEHIATTLARKSGLAVDKLLMDDKRKLLALLPALQEKIKGQDQALKTVSDAILRAWTGLQNPRRPLASFLFIGPTGTGKTETALTIAEQIFESKKSFWRFNMSEFSESFSLSSLLGSPPGYVGHDHIPALGVIRERVSNVILFDEISKSHPKVINLFLQILDEGYARLANGREVNFKGSILIFTSSVSPEIYPDYLDNEKEEENNEKVREFLKKNFSLEFLNRLNEIVFFKPLNKKIIEEIIVKELRDFLQRIERDRRVKFEFTSSLIKKIFQQSYDPELGARQIRYYIEKEIGTLVARYVTFQLIKQGTNYLLDVEKETNQIKLTSLSFLEGDKKRNR